MCGLAGVVVGRGGSRDGWDPSETLERMSARLAHRGPDDQGLAWDGRCGLAHRRLSVIDLSVAGRQPMRSPSGVTTLVWNGELYNFRELKQQKNLEQEAGPFRSRTDTEVVLHLLERSGPAALEEFDGMFALAAWDSRGQKLLRSKMARLLVLEVILKLGRCAAPKQSVSILVVRLSFRDLWSHTITLVRILILYCR